MAAQPAAHGVMALIGEISAALNDLKAKAKIISMWRENNQYQWRHQWRRENGVINQRRNRQ
jgi:hypothetical protein